MMVPAAVERRGVPRARPVPAGTSRSNGSSLALLHSRVYSYLESRLYERAEMAKKRKATDLRCAKVASSLQICRTQSHVLRLQRNMKQHYAFEQDVADQASQHARASATCCRKFRRLCRNLLRLEGNCWRCDAMFTGLDAAVNSQSRRSLLSCKIPASHRKCAMLPLCRRIVAEACCNLAHCDDSCRA